VRRALTVAALALAPLAACALGAPQPRDLEVEVRAEDGAPIAGAQLRVNGDYLGTTSPLGRATLRVPASAGERVPLSVTCPAGFSAAPAEQVVPLSGVEPAKGPLRLSCQTEQREAVVVVHATGSTAGLPVLVDGVPVGQTDALGFAHVHVRARPDSAFDVSLDTSANDKLSPTNPSQRFELDTNDQVFVFDTTFDTPRPAKQRRGKRRARGT